MRTSLNDIMLIEKHLEGRLSSEEVVAFNERCKRDVLFRINGSIQSSLLKLIRCYHRKKVRRELDRIHQQLMETGPDKSIQSLFKP